MPGIGDFFRKAGDVAGTGLGVALTPLAMLEAARGGQNPFEVLRQAQEGGQQREQAAILKQAEALNNPALRGLLTQQPDLAGTFGVNTVPSGIASPEVLANAPGAANAPGGQVPVFGQRYTSPTEQLAQSKLGYQNLINQLLGGMGGGEQALPPIPGGGGGGGAAAPGRPAMRLQSIGPGGPTFGVTPTKEVQAGTINPSTGQPYQPGEKYPSGETVVIPPSKGAQSNRQRLTLIDSALQGFKSIYGTRIDPKSGKASPTGVLPHESLPSATDLGGTAGLISAVAPGVFGIYNSVKAAYGNAASQAIKTGEGTVVTFVKAMGDAANAAQEEQTRAINAFLPNSGDTREVAQLKEQLTPRVLEAVREKLTALEQSGKPVTDAEAWGILSQAASEVAQAAGVGVGEQQPGQGGGGGDIEAARARVRALGGGGKVLKRQMGGPVPAGRTALVGEAGPELVQGPAKVTPLTNLAGPVKTIQQQLAQTTKRLGLGPGVSAPNAPMAAPPPVGGGFGAGQGLSPADAAAAQSQHGTITLGPGGEPVFVRQ